LGVNARERLRRSNGSPRRSTWIRRPVVGVADGIDDVARKQAEGRGRDVDDGRQPVGIVRPAGARTSPAVAGMVGRERDVGSSVNVCAATSAGGAESAVIAEAKTR
jgi:hypothetical protein